METGMLMLERPLTRREHADAISNLRAAVEPVMKAKAHLLMLATPTWILYPDGRIEKTSDGLSDGLRATLAQLDELEKFAAGPYLRELARGLCEDS